VCLLLGCGDFGIYGVPLQPVRLCLSMLTAGVSSCCDLESFAHL